MHTHGRRRDGRFWEGGAPEIRAYMSSGVAASEQIREERGRRRGLALVGTLTWAAGALGSRVDRSPGDLQIVTDEDEISRCWCLGSQET